MAEESRAALLARLDQSIEKAIAAAIHDAALLDDFPAYEATGALFEHVMAHPRWDREALAMAYAQLSVRLSRTVRGIGIPS